MSQNIALEQFPIDFHCHSVGSVDFTDLENISLQNIEKSLSMRNSRAILTFYLPRSQFDRFLEMIKEFGDGVKRGLFTHIVGLALEGPLLSSIGGTPEQGVWEPTKKQWNDLSGCGENGLIYIVMSPDYDLSNSSENINISWIFETLLDGGVMPAFGHFQKNDPYGCAGKMSELFSILEKKKVGPIVTDHMFNDMPTNIKYAWRTIEERKNREKELRKLRLHDWSLDNLEKTLGSVPATIIKAALKGQVKMCMNFDGEHVDLAITKRIVDLVGAENFLLMTDQIESRLLGGQKLTQSEESTLLYQQDGIVAGGSQSVSRQLQNMKKTKFTEIQIRQISRVVPETVLKRRGLNN